MTDEALLESARSGDEGAFRMLYERYRDPLYRFGWRLTGSPETAEDIVHDSFLALLSGGRFSAGRGPLRAYLYGAVRNLARKHVRDNAREEVTEAGPDDAREPQDFLEGLIAEEVAVQVREAVADLPFPQREVLVLADYEDLGMAEIGAVVSADANTVKARLFRARQGLRRRLAAMVVEHERQGQTRA
jgi:RNA polymerase sigma-70 factor (ECF subfamily)